MVPAGSEYRAIFLIEEDDVYALDIRFVDTYLETKGVARKNFVPPMSFWSEVGSDRGAEITGTAQTGVVHVRVCRGL